MGVDANAPPGPAPGRVLADRYEVGAELGRGAAGVVHRAWDRVLDRPVAVKLLDRRTDALDRDRLLHEARAAAAMSHPHIVGIHDAGEDGDTPYLVMELVEGSNLRQLASPDWPTIVRLADEVLQALEHAHGRGLIHRDLKPENILIEMAGGVPRARLADFSVARVGTRRTATLDGGIVGTPLYLAPEQALGDAIDGRADLYSLGAVLYELASGRPPFSGADALVVIAEHLHAPLVPPRTWRSDVPPMLEAVIVRLLAKRAEDRFADAATTRTALLAARLTGDDAPAASAPGAPMLLSQLARGRLVGRRTELDRLRGILTESLGGRGQMVVISGEPGVGKSRLAQEMLVQARLAGAKVLRGGSYEFEATTPYLPFTEALRGWIHESSDEALREATADIASDLARLAPELAERVGPFPERPPLTPGEERMRLYEAVARLFRRLATRGLVVFLDDLHWADQGSLALVHALLRQVTSDRILILGAYREVELDRSHPLAAALVEWNRERLVTRLALGRLSMEETRAFLATLFGQETVGDAFARAIHRETEGNPFFLEEVVKALIEQGQIYRDGNSWMSETAENLAIPQSVKEAIGRRLERLSPVCLEALHLAAALGKVFTFAELAASSGRTEDELLDVLDEAGRAQLIRSDSGESFAFTHDKIREVLYAETNPVRRRRQHLKILDAMERIHAGNLPGRASDLAHHAVLGGDMERGYRHSMAAVARAEEVYAHDDATRFADQARECAEALGNREGIVEACRARSRVEFNSGLSAAAAATLVAALPFVDDAHRRNGIEIAIGQHYASVGDERGLPHLEAVMARLDREKEPDQAARAMAILARYHHYRLEQQAAVDLLREAERYAMIKQHPATLTTIMSYLAGAYQHLGDFPASLELSSRLTRFGEEHDYPHATALGHEFQAEVLIMLGRVNDANEQAAEVRRIGTEMGARDRLAWADFIDLLAHRSAGRFTAAIESGERGLAMAEQIGELRVAGFFAGWLTLALAERGDAAAWPAMAVRARHFVIVSKQRWAHLIVEAVMVRVHLAAGDVAGAMATLSAPGLEETGDNHLALIERLLSRAAGLNAAGRHAEALTDADRLVQVTTVSGARFYRGAGLSQRGSACLGLGDFDSASENFDAALAIQEEFDHRWERARTLAARADLAERRAAQPGLPEDEAAAWMERARRDRDESSRLHDQCKSRGASAV